VKVVTVVGTRPEIIRLSRTMALLDTTAEQTIINTGQNSSRELNRIFFDELGLRLPDHDLECSVDSYGSFVAEALTRIEPILESVKPDAFLILGDTNSSLTALVAKKMQIPIYHLEAGNRAFDVNIPEEVNRRVIDHLADFNFPYSEAARGNLLAEGLAPRHVMLTGSPMPEIISHYSAKFDGSRVLERLNVKPQEYFVVSAHRAENVDSPARLSALLANLERLGESSGLPILISTHPRTRDRMQKAGLDEAASGLRFHEPFGFLDYIQLQRNARCVLSDSGTVSEEAAVVRFPAVTIRGAMERPEALESGVLVMSDVTSPLEDAVSWAIANWANGEVPPEYEVLNFSHRVVNAIHSTAALHRSWSGLR
jgi:UDP-N-acetylglucosamine 2-epimerase (non-hydrolysing)